LQGALEGVSGFGKVKEKKIQAVSQPIHERQNSNPTVTGTGMAREEQEMESV